MKTWEIVLIAVGALILLPSLTGGTGLLGSSTVANPNLLATLSANQNESYAGDVTSILSDFSSST
jgi:hypothetical protein